MNRHVEQGQNEQDIEIACLLQAVFLRWGYDFRDYAPESMRRRVFQFLCDNDYARVSDLMHDIVRDCQLGQHFVKSITVNVTDMFRDPIFYRAIRSHVMQELATHPFIRIWHAGCSTGEEAYSMAILMHELGLGNRIIIYATDINSDVLEHARRGVYSEKTLAKASENYQASGGSRSFSDYVSVGYGRYLIDPDLQKNIVFTQHDLVTDQVFGEMQLVVCRNVLIYFRRELQAKVLALFYASLDLGGYLGLGLREALSPFPNIDYLHMVDSEAKIFQRIK